MDIINYELSLNHYGVKGMKWGVRKDNRLRGRQKRISNWNRGISKDYKKRYNISSEEADRYAAERNRKVKKVLIGAAAITGVAIGTAVAIKYGRMYGDDILRAGSKIQTVHMDQNIINTGKFYTTNKKIDKIKYIGEFGRDKTTGALKKKIEGDVTSDIKSLGVRNGQKLYDNLVKTNPEFRDSVQKIGGLKFDMIKGLVKEDSNTPIDYKTFNTHGLLGSGKLANIKDVSKAQKIFFNEASKKGYGAIADVNDRINSGFNTKANIVFNTKPISNIKVSDITLNEVVKNKIVANNIIQGQNAATPVNMLYAGLVGTAASVSVVDSKMNKKIEKERKRNKTSKEV